MPEVNDPPVGYSPPSRTTDPGREVNRDGPALDAGTIRTKPRSRRPAKRKHSKWLVTVACVAGFVATAACGAGSWFLLHDQVGDFSASDQRHPGDSAALETSIKANPLGSRDTDAEPLSIDELFGAGQLDPEGGAIYQVLGSELLDECADAATEQMVALLATADCSQIARATVSQPDSPYLATVGVVNLADETAAVHLRDQLDGGSGGGFTALRVDGDGQDLGLNPTILGFSAYGHYLLYAVVGRADGKAPDRDDKAVTAIVSELVDTFLVDQLTPRQNG